MRCTTRRATHAPHFGGSVLSRLAALLTVAMAATVAGARVAGASPGRYDAVLVGAVTLGAVLAAARMWHDNSFESRLVVVVLTLLTVAGQVLVATIGRPDGSHAAHWYPEAVVVVVLGVAVLVLIAADARARSRTMTEEHPYAL